MIVRVGVKGTPCLILGIKKGIISTTKERRNKYWKVVLIMENLTKEQIEKINQAYDFISF